MSFNKTSYNNDIIEVKTIQKSGCLGKSHFGGFTICSLQKELITF